MSDAVVTLLAGLGGALIGGGAAVGAQWLTISAQREVERRRATVDLVSKFWDAAERLLSAQYEVQFAHSRKHSEGGSAEHLDRLIRTRESIDSEGRFLAAQMRLLRLPVAEHAERVLKTTRFYDPEKPGQPEARMQALLDYEEAATTLLASMD